MKLVLIESPYAGDVEKNTEYARSCVKHSLSLGEAPFASHLFYTQILDDKNRKERSKGIEAGLAWGQKAELTAVYTDLGISEGMKIGIERAKKQGREIVYRNIL